MIFFSFRYTFLIIQHFVEVFLLYMCKGFNFWLNCVQGINLRTDNEPLKVSLLIFCHYNIKCFGF